MPLTPGTRLGPYEIRSALGAGGMGEVYRAHDAKLNRDVAIKVLLPAIANDPDRLARFSREAQVLASLNHPNIAAIYGLEDAGDVRALVMELVEGPTLADRIAQGAIPLADALPIAKQIAEALEAAHEQGIIHRDLKPANIKVRLDGTVKVLDFGLAKAMEPAGASSANAMNSPTISMHATKAGIILGTAAYMSPEQAAGKPVDKRSDLWAFGVVLLEMLTGRQVFDGETVSHVLAAVLTKDPDWTTLPANTPASIRKLLRRCLEKDRKRRLPDAADIRLDIDDALSAPAGPPSTPSATLRRRPRDLALAGLVGIGIGIGIGAALVLMPWRGRRSSEAPPQAIRFTVETPQLMTTFSVGVSSIALAPDGTQLAYVTEGGPLYVRRLDQVVARAIPGTLGAVGPFFSPDGQSVAFSAAGKLQKARVTGGSQLICDVKSFLGGTWGADGTIVFAQVDAGLSRVAENGGSPTPLTTIESGETHAWPQWPSGSNWVLFTRWSNADRRSNAGEPGQIIALSLKTGERRVLVNNGLQATATGNHLVYRESGSLLSVGLDPVTLSVRGSPTPTADVARQSAFGSLHYAVAGNVVAYVPAIVDQPERRLAWVDRHGVAQPIQAPPQAYSFPRVSPDGRRIAVEGDSNVWMYDLLRGSTTKLTFEGSNSRSVWTPDGSRVTFASDRAGGFSNIYWTLADGSGGTERLTTSPFRQVPEAWTPDGRTLAFSEFQPATGWDIWMLTLSERKPRVFLQTPFHDGARSFSPDGRWLAYFSDESSRGEIFVRAYPGPGPKVQISTQGGSEPVWARNGRELFYRVGDTLMTVDVTLQPTFAVGKPRELFRGSFFGGLTPAQYDVAPDGQRFVMIPSNPRESAPARVTIVVNAR